MASGDWISTPEDLSRCRHEVPKEVYEELERWVKQGWRLRRGAHKFILYCPPGGGCHISIGGTPKDAARTARRIAQMCRNCVCDNE